MIAKTGTYVRIRYTVKLESGEIIKGDPNDSLEYLDFITGFDQVVPGLESRLIGYNRGDHVELRIPPEEAFGPYNPSLVQERTFDDFPEGTSLEPGKWAVASNEQYKIQDGYLVKEKGPNSVTLDYNHPLAGKALIYELSITEERPARQDELALIKPCDFDAEMKKNNIIETALGEDE